MNRLAVLVSLLVSIGVIPARAIAPVSIETNWNVKTFSISTTGVTSATFDIGGFGADGYAIQGHSYRANGVDGTTLGAVSTVSSNTTNVVGFSYSALPIGGGANLQIAQTIRTSPPAGLVSQSTNFNSQFPGAAYFTVPLISTSSVIATPASVPIADVFPAVVTNPIFYFTGLTSAATLYFSVDYGIPRQQ